MKRGLAIGFSILMLCSLLMATVKAGNMDYAMTEYWAQVTPTIDGEWTSADEWTDCPTMNVSDNVIFKYKMDTSTGSYAMQWLIEVFNDNTTDTGDYFEICLDNDNSGGTAPGTTCYMIKITGHDTMTFYKGTGSAWGTASPATDEITWANTISESPLNATPHWILEVMDNDKQTGTMQIGQPPNGLRIAAYDDDSSTLADWAPGSSPDVPDEWGVIETYSSDPFVPEAFSVVVVVLLSSVAVAVGFYFTRKPSKTVINYTI